VFVLVSVPASAFALQHVAVRALRVP